MSVTWRNLPDDSDDDEGGQYRQYEQTLMYGHYKRDIAHYIKEEAKKLRERKKVTYEKRPTVCEVYEGRAHNKCILLLLKIWKHIQVKIGEDWIFLAVLGITMAFISFLVDFLTDICLNARMMLYRDLASSNRIVQYLSWISFPICVTVASAGFVRLVAPQAAGSGIPEVKTILRGVVLKEYLAFETLVVKIIGLIATLASGLPLGKMGPFVHIASMVANLLSKGVVSFKGIYENESRKSEMLAAACAVGVASTFATPFGGVLFSIEVTSVYFAIRNYWRGLFSAACGAIMFRLLAVWFKNEDTLTPLFKTIFKSHPFSPLELFVYALTGIVCGFLGASFVWVHRQYVMFIRRNKKMKAFLQKNYFIYPSLIVLVWSTLIFPPGMGMFNAGELTVLPQVHQLLNNITWTKENPSVLEFQIIENWRSPWTSIFVNLSFFIVITYFGTVVASTLPIPAGIFINFLKMGAAFGRIVGEGMSVMFPTGLTYGGIQYVIIPGGYAMAGAAAFAGATTHTVSPAILLFELTGQITHVLPVMISVLIANGIAQLLQPSVFDSIIRIKKLPFLPNIFTSASGAHTVYVEDFMVRNMTYIWHGITFNELNSILIDNKKIRSLPLVDSPGSMILLGSVKRSELIAIMGYHLRGDKKTKFEHQLKNGIEKVNLNEVETKRNTKTEHGVLSHIFPSTEWITSLAGLTCRAYDKAAKRNANFERPKLHTTPSTANNLLESTILKSASYDQVINAEASSLLTCAPQTTHPSTSAKTSTNVPGPKKRETKCAPKGNRQSLSRFAVTKVGSPSTNESPEIHLGDAIQISSEATSRLSSKSSANFPIKSILKETGSPILTSPEKSPLASPTNERSPIMDYRFRQTRPQEQELKEPKLRTSASLPSFRSLITSSKLLEKAKEKEKQMREEELMQKVDFSSCQVDPAPFQLVERTTLLKTHALFSMLGLNHAYVTAIGRLIGVVSLKELRKAIEDANQGEFLKREVEIDDKIAREELLAKEA